MRTETPTGQKKGSRKARGWISARYGALSGGVSDSENGVFRNMWASINRGYFPHNTSAFSINIEARRSGDKTTEESYRSIWVKTPNGAYTVVRTLTTENKKAEPEPAYVVLFSPDPSVLGRCFVHDQDKGFHNSPEARESIEVISARRERDIVFNLRRVGDDFNNPAFEQQRVRLDFAWVRRDIEKHSMQYEQLLRRHGILIHRHDLDTWQSASSLFWLEKEPGPNDKKYHVYYHCNHVHTGDGFLGERTLENPKFLDHLKWFSVRLTEEPLSKKEAEDLVRKKAVSLTTAIISGQEPYTLKPENPAEIADSQSPRLDKKLHRLFMTGLLRGMQKTGSAAANINVKSLGARLAGTIISTAGIYFLTSFPILLGFIPIPRSNFITNAPTKAFRAIKSFLVVVDQSRIRPDRDIAERYVSESAVHFNVDGGRRCLLDPSFIYHMRPVDFRRFTRVFGQIPEFNEETELEWGKSIIFDTLGCHAGTIFSKRVLHGDIWIEAQQPNGVTVAYNSRLRIALARVAGPPLPGSVLEKPVADLFKKTLKPGDHQIGVFINDEGRLEAHGLKEDQLPPFMQNGLTVGDDTPAPDPSAFLRMMAQKPSSGLVQKFSDAVAERAQAAAIALCVASFSIGADYKSFLMYFRQSQFYTQRDKQPATDTVYPS